MYQTYAWPAITNNYQVSFFNCLRQASTVISVSGSQNRISYDAPNDIPGLLVVTPVFSGGNGRPYTFPINNPPSLANIRWMVRDALADFAEKEDGVDVQYPETPKWSDDEINTQIREAIGLVNRYIRQEVIIETTVEKFRQDRMRDIQEINSVSFLNPSTEAMIETPRYSRRALLRTRSGFDRYWDIVNGSLYIYGTLPDDAQLEISADIPYPTPLNDIQELQVDPIDWDVLTLYAQGKCLLRVAGQSAQLDRWKEEGRRNDNPVMPVARALLTEAQERIAARRGPRVVRRYRR